MTEGFQRFALRHAGEIVRLGLHRAGGTAGGGPLGPADGDAPLESTAREAALKAFAALRSGWRDEAASGGGGEAGGGESPLVRLRAAAAEAAAGSGGAKGGGEPDAAEILLACLLHARRIEEPHRRVLLLHHLYEQPVEGIEPLPRAGKQADIRAADSHAPAGEILRDAVRILADESAVRGWPMRPGALASLVAVAPPAGESGRAACPRPRALADRAAGRIGLSARDRLDRHILLCRRCLDDEDAERARLAWGLAGPEDFTLYGGADSLLLPWERRELLADLERRAGRPGRFPWRRG